MTNFAVVMADAQKRPSVGQSACPSVNAIHDTTVPAGCSHGQSMPDATVNFVTLCQKQTLDL